MAGPPGVDVVDVTNILSKAVGVAGVSLTSTNHDAVSSLVVGTGYPLICDIVSGKVQRPSVYIVVGIFTIQKLL